MNHNKLSGLIAAVLTPLEAGTGALQLSVIPSYADHLIRSGVAGFYCCGSTGEGISLTTDERKLVTEAWVSAAKGRVPVIVQVGHNSTREAALLAQHAQQCGADAVSATCPSYFKVDSIASLIECMGEIASGASKLPFYYYHIPSLTGNRLSMPDFLESAGPKITNLVGMKYTSTELFEFLQCLSVSNGKYEVIWGVDEMLLGAMAMGATAAIGSTYNVATPLYTKLIGAFRAGDLDAARKIQLQSIQMINQLKRYPFFAALKSVVSSQGFQMGGCRSPNGNLSAAQADQLLADLRKLDLNLL